MTACLSLVLVLLLTCLRLGLVYIYKRTFSRTWSVGDAMDKWMNVVVNTSVVIPFTLYQCPVTELKAGQILAEHMELKWPNLLIHLAIFYPKHCTAQY